MRLFLSGPAAGVIGGAIVGRSSGHRDLITIDVGGTSSDIALVEGGEPVIRAQGSIAGFTVRVPMVDVNAIGAGGGSIAWLDGAGGLRVGPHSAGSEPGPACYGRGGEAATVTDASVVLGWLDPGVFRRRLRSRSIRHWRAQRSNATSPRRSACRWKTPRSASTAWSTRRWSRASGWCRSAAASIRARFTLVALGGAGPIHATALAAELGIGSVLIPRHPGVLSAAGLLAAPIEHEVATAFPRAARRPCVRPTCAACWTSWMRSCARLMAEESIGGMPSRSSIPPTSGTSASRTIWKCR